MAKKFTDIDALISLCPGAAWSKVDGVFTWLDSNKKKPTNKEISDEIKKLQAEYENSEYQRLRAVEYPSINEQLDTIFHQGLDVWKEQIQAVKDKYPKP